MQMRLVVQGGARVLARVGREAVGVDVEVRDESLALGSSMASPVHFGSGRLSVVVRTWWVWVLDCR